MKNTILTGILLGALALTLGGSALCAPQTILYQHTFSGREFYDMQPPPFPVPARTPTLDGDTLVYGPGVSDLEVLLKFLIPFTNTLDRSKESHVILRIDADLMSGDNDLVLGLTDETNLLGAERTDQGNTYFMTGLYGEPTYTVSYAPGVSAIDRAFTVDFALHGDTTGTIYVGEESASHIFGPNLDPMPGLSLVIGGNNSFETYRINSVAVTVTTESPVPEPGVSGLVAIGLIGTVLGLRKQ